VWQKRFHPQEGLVLVVSQSPRVSRFRLIILLYLFLLIIEVFNFMVELQSVSLSNYSLFPCLITFVTSSHVRVSESNSHADPARNIAHIYGYKGESGRLLVI
jgi:hypothetical protein